MSDSALHIPGYLLHGPLGKGGMAEVHLATQQSLQRQVAIKILGNAADQELVQRFVREGHLLAALHHPAIVTVYDIDRLADGRPYLVMEYLAGGDLAQHKGELFAAPRALAIVRQIAAGLAVVHAKGLVHRDVKPANILFRADGSAVLGDFGVAKDLDLDSELTQCGIAVGSPAYSSPEQAQCQALDARSDIYSLGVILLEMLSGENPFRAGNYTQTVVNHLQLAPPRLPAHLAGCQALLDGMLGKEPAQRFADCQALLAAIDALDLDDPDATRIGPAPVLHTRRETPAAPVAGGARRPRWALLLGGAALLLALGAGGFYWQQQREVHALLASAERSLQEGRLLAPEGDNADYFFRQALRVDSRSQAARAGLERVRQARVGELLALGEQRLQAGQLVAPEGDSAEHYFNQALALDADSGAARDALRRLHEARIAASLALAERRSAEHRLLQPENDSAVFHYRQVLAWAPGQAQALAGLHEIAQQYREQANAAYRRGNFPAALAMIDNGLLVEPQSAELLQMRSEHQELLSSARAARAAARRNRATPHEAPAAEQAPPPQAQGNLFKRTWHNLFGN